MMIQQVLLDCKVCLKCRFCVHLIYCYKNLMTNLRMVLLLTSRLVHLLIFRNLNADADLVTALNTWLNIHCVELVVRYVFDHHSRLLHSRESRLHRTGRSANHRAVQWHLLSIIGGLPDSAYPGCESSPTKAVSLCNLAARQSGADVQNSTVLSGCLCTPNDSVLLNSCLSLFTLCNVSSTSRLLRCLLRIMSTYWTLAEIPVEKLNGK